MGCDPASLSECSFHVKPHLSGTSSLFLFYFSPIMDPKKSQVTEKRNMVEKHRIQEAFRQPKV
jgi:hypothetical protein